MSVISDKFHVNYHQDSGMKVKIGLQNISVIENKTKGKWNFSNIDKLDLNYLLK